ncbi:HSP20-like chaperone [Pisolithus thermaeus]|nr:HSP20-like chaperone [Pisolithus croceorrhizus]KAI6160701.1 HSP20-like chaperone [Pisolithus thermaeus]
MTVTTTALIHNKLSRIPLSQEERFRALDRDLARRYVTLLLHQARMSEARRLGQGELLYRPRVEICDNPSSSRITATVELPGVTVEDITLQVGTNSTLRISGERKRRISPVPGTDTKYPLQEIKYGKFERVLQLPEGTMMSTISAAVDNGVLVVSWPRLPPSATTSGSTSGKG